MKTRAGESYPSGWYATVLVGSLLASGSAIPLAGQGYSLDDWMTVSSEPAGLACCKRVHGVASWVSRCPHTRTRVRP